MAANYTRIEYRPALIVELEQTDDGLYYVEDGEDGRYEIEAFLGDLSPICQVFKANYFIEKTIDDDDDDQSDSDGEIEDEIHQVMALKLARDDGSAEFLNLKQVVENSFKIGPDGDIAQENNNVITDNHIIVGIYKIFNYRNILCVAMPYFEGGSLRYIINTRISSWRLPEKCIAVVLREILRGLCFLHGRRRVHKNLNAGNIFLGGFYSPFRGPVTIKLGYQGSIYFHCPEADYGTRIWDESWDPAIGGLLLCTASGSLVNRFWTIQGIYEPKKGDEERYITPESDIWNLGVTALELAFGPFCDYNGNMSTTDDLRNPQEFRTFLTELCYNDLMKLPRLFELFLPDPGSRTATITSTCIAAARKIFESCLKFCEKSDHDSEEDQSSGDGQELFTSDVDDQLSNSFTAMVKKCLIYDPEKRPTAQELLNDPFFEENQDADLQYLKNAILSYRIHPNHQSYRNFCMQSSRASKEYQ